MVRQVAEDACQAREEKELWGMGGRGGEIGNRDCNPSQQYHGGVEVGESALIGAVEGCWTLLDNKPLL